MREATERSDDRRRARRVGGADGDRCRTKAWVADDARGVTGGDDDCDTSGAGERDREVQRVDAVAGRRRVNAEREVRDVDLVGVGRDPVQAGHDGGQRGVAVGVGDLDDVDRRARGDTETIAATAGNLAAGDQRGHEGAVTVVVSKDAVLLHVPVRRVQAGRVDGVDEATGRPVQGSGVSDAGVDQCDSDATTSARVAGRPPSVLEAMTPTLGTATAASCGRAEVAPKESGPRGTTGTTGRRTGGKTRLGGRAGSVRTRVARNPRCWSPSASRPPKELLSRWAVTFGSTPRTPGVAASCASCAEVPSTISLFTPAKHRLNPQAGHGDGTVAGERNDGL